MPLFPENREFEKLAAVQNQYNCKGSCPHSFRQGKQNRRGLHGKGLAEREKKERILLERAHK